MEVRIEWIDYLKLYRVYDAENPSCTIAYENNKEEIIRRLEEQGCKYSFDS